MRPLPIAVALEHLGLPLRAAVTKAPQLGASGIHAEVRHLMNPADLSATGRRQLKHLLAEQNLGVAALRFPARRTFYNEEHLETRMEALTDAMQLAYDVGAKVLTTRIGRIPDEETGDARQMLHEVLSDLAGKANRIGVSLAITPAGDSPQTLHTFLRGITTGPVGLDFDPAGLVLSHVEPPDAFSLLHEHVLHVTGRDAVRDVDGTGVEVQLGRGEAEWETLLALFDQANYSGWITVERTAGEEKVDDMARAVVWLRRVGSE